MPGTEPSSYKSPQRKLVRSEEVMVSQRTQRVRDDLIHFVAQQSAQAHEEQNRDYLSGLV